MSAASSGEKNVPGTLCAMARRNSPAARGIASSAATDPPPADWPKTVTRSGSPPKARMLSRTHSSAATWSSRPRLAGAPSICAKPSMPDAVVERHHDDAAVPREPAAVVLGEAGHADHVARRPGSTP